MNPLSKILMIVGLFAAHHTLFGQELADNSNSLSFTEYSSVSLRDTRSADNVSDYAVGINQVFVLSALRTEKNYYIYSAFPRAVNIHIYGTSGQLLTRIKYMLEPGNNYVGRELLQQLPPDKYTVLVSDAANANIASTMTVMY